MNVNAVLLNTADNVVTVTEAIAKGENAVYLKGNENCSVTAAEDIPIYHKIALKAMEKGAHVIKYGQIIGGVTEDIVCGQLLNHKNIVSLPRNYEDELQ